MKKFYEETLEDLIFNNAKTAEGRKVLETCGLEIKGKLIRQVTIGNYGRADLISLYVNGKEDGKHRVYVTVYELKKDNIGKKVVFQAARYIYGLRKFFERSKYAKDYSLNLKAVIIGSQIEDDGYYEFISALCPSLELYTYDYKISGLSFRKITLNDRGGNFSSLDELLEKFDKSDLRDIFDNMLPVLPF